MTAQADSASAGSRYACTSCRLLYRSGLRRCPLDAGDIVELAPWDDPLLGSTLGGRYLIEEVVVDDDGGRIYRASHTELPRSFSVVIPYGEIAAVGATRSRFRHAAQAASRLDHPNVVPVIDVGETEERLLYVVTEEVNGRDLRSILSLDSPLEPDRVLSLARQLARGLQHAHEQGVRHGDLRAEHVVVVNEDGAEIPRIILFGLTTQKAEAQSDLHRLGLMFYEMLAGCPAFDEEDAFDGIGETPPPIRERAPDALPCPEVERVALRLLAPEQAARYRTAAAVVEDLEPGAALVAETPPVETLPVATPAAAPAAFDLAIDEPDKPVTLPARRRTRLPTPVDELMATEPTRRRPLALAAGGLVLLAVAGVVAFILLRGGDEETQVASALAATVADAAPAPAPGPAAAPAPEPPAAADAAPIAAAEPTPPPAPTPEPPAAPIRKVVASAPPPRAPAPRAPAPKAATATRPVEPPRSAAPPPAAPPPRAPVAAPPTSDGQKTAASRQAAEALVRDGAKLYLSGRTDEAKKKFQGALLLDSRSAAAHRGLGFAYQKLGDNGKAAQHLQRYLDLAPSARDAGDIRARLQSLGK